MSADPDPHPDLGTRVFETFVRVRFHEVDALGHVNNAAYLNYLEQAAIDHALAVGLDLERLRSLGGIFVARRHDIVFLRPTFAGDLLRVVTWLGLPRGARVERGYLVFREPFPIRAVALLGRVAAAGDVSMTGDIVARALTEWVFASGQGRPRRIPEEVVSVFHSGNGQESPQTGNGV